MTVFRKACDLRHWSDQCSKNDETIALVPTMGALHDGHLSLITLAQKHASQVVVSIFVNPKQFGPHEDLDEYPREEREDIAKATSAGATTFYCPSPASMYDEHFQTSVSVANLQRHLCGASRNGHFDGVTTVVTKLFLAARPDVAVFGQKDYQQLAIIKRMVKDLDFGIEIVGAPIHREQDGLAMSSRNRYLSQNERAQSLSLYKSIVLVENLFKSGERNVNVLVQAARDLISKEPLAAIEYVSIQNALTLEPVEVIKNKCLLALAVRFSKTRLIDNTVLDPNK